ncbi:MAG: hypothetical protein A2036_01715 [Omnitrophica bacterium GWA2_50_21]|nr:MAG: hypothetical protein A2036_01715 [Omnitrophica bacterium GWA2_50_21]
MSQIELRGEDRFLDGRLCLRKDKAVVGYHKNGFLHFNYPLKNGEFHGICQAWSETGVLLVEEEYFEGKHHGWKRLFYDSGEHSSEEFFRNGLPDGNSLEWYENGRVKAEETRIRSSHESMKQEWYEDGTLKAKRQFKDGKPSGKAVVWYPTSQIESQSFYRNGMAEGLWQVWYENGNLRHEIPYSRGRYHGMMRKWYESGKIWAQIPYRDGLVHGVQRVWDAEGKSIKDSLFVRGVRASKDLEFCLARIKAGNFRAKEIIGIMNTSVRRILLEEFGYSRFLAELDHTVLDKDGENELVRIDWRRGEEPIFLAKVKCPSTGAFYALRVPPSVTGVKQAIAWTFQIPGDQYQPDIET